MVTNAYFFLMKLKGTTKVGKTAMLSSELKQYPAFSIFCEFCDINQGRFISI